MAHARRDDGFGWLDDDGRDDVSHGLELWINARMTYVFSLAALMDVDGARELAAHGVAALAGPLHDDRHGGWFDELDTAGAPVLTDKGCYGHAFVLLAGSVAQVAEIDGAATIFDEAQRVHAERFWDAPSGRCVETWSRDWTELDPYRGANANMHAVEAYLFTADATGDSTWLQRALSICEHVIGVSAREHDWRVPEHFDTDWQPQLELNRDRPADPFRPYGATPGHAFEWARLLVMVAAATDDPRPWLLEAAEQLVARAVADVVDDSPLLPYTTDWSGRPVVTERFHWVVAEAVQAAEVLAATTGEARYPGLAARWWSEIDEHVIDTDGSWRHELTSSLGPSTRTWRGRPDAYHGFNALTCPDLPAAPTAAVALRGGSA